MIIQIIVGILHALIIWLLTFVFDMGVYGPPVAISISNLLHFIGMTHYCVIRKGDKVKQALKMPDKRAFQMKGIC